MGSALIIPGVQVRTIFEPTPPLPGATGILGVVGVTDRGPLEPTPLGSFSEFVETFGAASRYTLPEVRDALANGVSRVVVARIAPGRGTKATLTLMDADGEAVVRLVARAEGAWGRRLSARVTEVRTLAGEGVKYLNLQILLDNQVVERIDNLVSDPGSPNYLFNKINTQSLLISAIDPVFEVSLPPATATTGLDEVNARAAAATLADAGVDVVTVTARRTGRRGNTVSVRISDGRAGLPLVAGDGSVSVDIQAREAGSDGTGFRVAVNTAAAGVNLVVTPPAGAPRTLGPAASVAEIVTAFSADPDLAAVAVGNALPAPVTSQALRRRVTVEVIAEGLDTTRYPDLPDLDAIVAIDDPTVRFAAVGGGATLPDNSSGTPLVGGRARGPALLIDAEAPAQPLLEFVPAQGAPENLSIRIGRGISSLDNVTAVVNVDVLVDDVVTASFADLTMDPDDPNYLPAVLADSGLVRALDLFIRSGTTSLPRGYVGARSFDSGGDAVSADDYQASLERLESAEEVDLVLASVANQLADAEVRAVHRQIVAHCERMAGPARSRIGMGSVTASDSGSVSAMIDHANDVRSDVFVLLAPAGMDSAFAGLLGKQRYFAAPTFKTVAAPGAPPGNYTDAQLEQLITANVCVVNRRRGRGTIVVKGILTSGRQVNVQRTAHKAVRDINAIANKFIGTLNNAGNRTALRQQCFALLSQMERDGALVPSTDGTDPAFKVDVIATQDDFAKGIVRIDIALRPVRAIDFIIATIFVQN